MVLLLKLLIRGFFFDSFSLNHSLIQNFPDLPILSSFLSLFITSPILFSSWQLSVIISFICLHVYCLFPMHGALTDIAALKSLLIRSSLQYYILIYLDLAL